MPDVLLAVGGYNDRVLDQQRLLAWHIAHVVPPHVSKKDRRKFSVKRLMGETKTSNPVSRRQRRAEKERSVTDGD
jgi:hypothetical protein